MKHEERDFLIEVDNFVGVLTALLKEQKKKGLQLRRIRCFEQGGQIGVFATFKSGTVMPLVISAGPDPKALAGIQTGDFWDVFIVGGAPWHYLVRM